jgi:hypothetical protein
MIDVMRCARATGRAGTSWQVARAAGDPGSGGGGGGPRGRDQVAALAASAYLAAHGPRAARASGTAGTRQAGRERQSQVFIGKLNRGFVARSQPTNG